MRLRYALAVVLIPATVCPLQSFAECSFTQDCGGGHGVHTHRFGSSSECESSLSRTRQAIAGQGGGCTFSSCSCSGSGGADGGLGLPSGMSNREMFNAAVGQAAVNALVPAFGKWLMTSEVEEGRKRRELERLNALERQRLADLENKCRKREAEAKFQVDKAELMGSIRGEVSGSTTTTGELGFRTLSIDPGQRHAESYTLREGERRDALSAIRADPARLDWCKKHVPLCPTRPVQEGWAGQYDAMMGAYAEKMSAWEGYCQGGSLPREFSEPSGAGGPALGFRNLEPPPPARPSPSSGQSAGLEEKHRAALGCAMAPVAKKAASIGPEGERLVLETKADLERFLRELRENPQSGASDTFKAFSDGVQHSEKSAAGEAMLFTSIQASRRESDGRVRLEVAYSFVEFSGPQPKKKDLVNLLYLSREGRVLGSRLSTDIGNDTRECMAKAFPRMACSYSGRAAECREPGAGPLE